MFAAWIKCEKTAEIISLFFQMDFRTKLRPFECLYENSRMDYLETNYMTRYWYKDMHKNMGIKLRRKTLCISCVPF